MATDMDEASLRLCIQLQSQDAVALIKGKKREDEQPPDIEFAAELYKFELHSLQTFYSDRALCRRLSRLGLKSGDPLRGRAEKEEPALNRTGSKADKVASKQSSISSTSDTGASVSIVDEETTSQSDDEVASTGSSISPTSDTSGSLETVEETTKPLATS